MTGKPLTKANTPLVYATLRQIGGVFHTCKFDGLTGGINIVTHKWDGRDDIVVLRMLLQFEDYNNFTLS